MDLKSLLMSASTKNIKELCIADILSLDKDAADKCWKVFSKAMDEGTGWKDVIKTIADSKDLSEREKYAVFLFIGGKIEKSKSK